MLGLKTNPTLLLYSLLLLFPAYNALETPEALPRTNDMSCIQNGFYNCSPQCFCNVSQDYFNTALAGISIFNLIWSFLFILCYFLLRELRQKPAEIILILAAANFLLAVKYIIEGINLLNSNPIIPRLNDPFCQEVGFMSMLLTNTLSFYQLTFYLYKVITLKNPIKASKITKKLYHTTTILLSLGLTIGEFMYGAIGRTIMGSCSLKTTPNYSIPAILGGVFLVLSIGLTFMLRRNMKQRRKDLNLKETRYAEHYLGYLIILCIVLIGVTAIQIDFSERIRKALTNYNIGKYTNSLNVLGLCVFALSNLNPLILTIGQIRDPTVWKPLKDRLRQIFCCENQERPIDQLAIPNRYLEPLMEKDENVMAGEARMELHSFRLGPPPIMQLNGVEYKNFNESMAIPKSIQKKKQPQMLCTLIAGLIHHWNQQKVQIANERDNGRETNNNYNIMKEAKTKKKLTIHETVLKKNLPQIHREIRNKNLKVRFGIFTSHAPVLFKDLIDYDSVEQELGNSIDLLRNFQNIMDAETVDKKLNFITFDNKFILKSITKNERRCLLRILPAYLNHLKTNPSSLLTRIYGLYKFEVMSPYHQLNWIVMKNVSERSGPSIERMYHLKGIRLDKFAMTTDSESNIPSSKEHSGEEYFERYERAIHVDHKTRQDLLKTVQRDVDFLISQGLFNYELNVSLVNRTVGTRFEERLCGSVILEVDESLEDKSCTPAGSMLARKLGSEYEEEKEGDNMGEETGRQREISRDMLVNLRNPFYAVESTRENLHYSIEIDSFMTQYSLRHRIKKLFCNACESESDDTLIPTAYGERLLDYARQIINDREQVFEYMANEEIEIEKR